MSAIFKLSVNETGDHYFSYINSRKELLMNSPLFASKAEAESAIQDVRVGSMMSQFIGKANTPTGELYFMISNASGVPVAKSVLFDNEMAFNNALHSVRENACIADIKADAAVS